MARFQVYGNAPEAAHGIYNVAFAIALSDSSVGFNGIQYACGGFAMHHGHVGNRRIGGKKKSSNASTDGDFVLRTFNTIVANAMHFGNLRHAFAVGAIYQKQ
jgi:hypothetical protein